MKGFLMNDEVKVRSFRISDSVTERFKAFCSDFDNQNVALDSLITAYEVQNAKAVLADRKTEISDYDMHIQAIQGAFLRSLELNENAEQRVQTTDKQLKAMQKEVSESNQALQNEKKRADTEQRAREQAETISAMLSKQVEELKGQLVQLKEQVMVLTDRAEQAETTSAKLSDELTKLNTAYAEVQRTLTAEQTSHAKELAVAEKEKETAVKSAIADTAGKYQRKIDEMQFKIDDMQTKQIEQIQALSQLLRADNTDSK